MAILLDRRQETGQFSQEITQLYSNFKKYHTNPEKKDLVKFLPDTPLQGAKLLSEPSLKVNKEISNFVARLVKRQFPWAERKNPLD